jgi:hypothetical protein
MNKPPIDHEPTRMIRIGTIVTPQEFGRMVAPSSSVPALTAHALLFYAPAHIVGAFQAQGQSVRSRVAVHSTDDEREHVMVMTLQREGVVVYGILPLSDSAVRAYVVDCIGRQSIKLIFALENSSRFAAVDIDSPFGHADRFDEFLNSAQPNPGGVQMLVEMTKEFLELPPAKPWVHELPVRHLFAVLAGSNAVSVLGRAKPADSSETEDTHVH